MGLKGVFLFAPYTNGFFGGGRCVNLFISRAMLIFFHIEKINFI